MKFNLKKEIRYRDFFKWTGIILASFIFVVLIIDGISCKSEDNNDVNPDNPVLTTTEESFGSCNVSIIDIKGFIDIEEYENGDVGSSDVVKAIENADISKGVKAIIVDVDSSGGYITAGEEISNALSRADKPSVALIRAIGTSAAYWASVGADVIFASVNSNIGSIGVTMSYLDNVKKNQKEGLTYNSISSGKFKDAGDPDKPLSYEERQYFMRDTDIIHNNFVKAIAEKRNLNIEKVKKLADGSSMLGQMALENGLIDKIGDLYDVRQYLADIIGEEVIICE